MTATAERPKARLLHELARMMDQQFWRWGCDAKHESGNLLVQYGFERVPPPDRQVASSSAYFLEPRGRTRIVLRSFAVFYGDDELGGLLLKRFDCKPYRTPAAELAAAPFQEADLPALVLAEPEDDAWYLLAAALVEQIIAYETWVLRRLGIAYVKETLTSRKKRPFVMADCEIITWQRFAVQLSCG